MFHKTSVRLALVYLGIIMAISVFFSVNVYRLSTQEFDRGFRRQTAFFENLSPFDSPLSNIRDQFLTQREDDINYAKNHIISQLLAINLLIFVGGGFLSYFLARRSLRPIEEAHDAQSRFTADASHELRTPLAAMQTEIEVALMKPDLKLDEAKKQLKSNLEELHKLTKLTDGLLRLSRLEYDSMVSERVPVDVIINTAITRVLATAETKKTLIESDIKDDIVVSGDEASLVEVVVILLDNAIKYSPNKSEIKVRATKEQHFANILVTDKGIGISSTEQEHIFERFYRADNARSKQKNDGYGLGLAIAKNIVDLHHGSIKVKSSQAKGTVFSVRLPLAKR